MLGHYAGALSNYVEYGYTHNPASGIASQTRNNDSYAWAGHYAVTRAYTTNGLNQYSAAGGASFGYDANGSLTAAPGPGSGETLTYVYDIENRLVGRTSTGASPVVTLAYDPLGRLFSSTASGTTTEFLHDGDAIVGEYVGGTQTERYVHGAAAADDPLIWYHGAGLTDRRQLHADHQGSIIAVSDGANALLAANRYDEYGIPGSGNQGRFQYTGQIWLPELGMYHYKARIYSPTLGRFLQTDAIGYDDQFNLYAYVGNDPVNMTDPTGMIQQQRIPNSCSRTGGTSCAGSYGRTSGAAAALSSPSRTGSRQSAPRPGSRGNNQQGGPGPVTAAVSAYLDAMADAAQEMGSSARDVLPVRGLARAVPGVDGVISYSERRREGASRTAAAAGATAEVLTGTAIGAAIGTFIEPGGGTLVGAAIGYGIDRAFGISDRNGDLASAGVTWVEQGGPNRTAGQILDRIRNSARGMTAEEFYGQ